ncbi:TetR/AcrR family transcriptional regulator [Nocardioides flavescens]|uniref:TetR family transcriptional regulator n=1 Tax=Nocardioides flavescens TaxID=2691959 RepID=A0A6L7F4H7_9ACTN|nr:TetR/AcrR family transcriptional regulator [Nocardioides flavescens]MXG92096.1 TetR family transcriptional regulator [Nocardioides flavescens]
MTSNRDAVLAAAQRTLNVDPGASVADIAQAAGVSRATVHRHFESREALLVELGTRSLDQWEQRMDAGDLEAVAASGDAARIRALLEALVRGYVEDADTYGFALTDHVILANADLVARTERLADRETGLFVAAQAAGVLSPALPGRWFGHAVYGLLVAGREAVRLGDVAPREAADLVLTTLFSGITAPSSTAPSSTAPSSTAPGAPA